MENLGTIVLAVGALGTASFGIVEGLKWTFIGLSGFRRIPNLLGDAVMKALELAYGPEYLSLLKAQYRANRTPGSCRNRFGRGRESASPPRRRRDWPIRWASSRKQT